MDKKIIILARISTSPQDIQSQTNDLKREATRLGFDEQNQIIIETIESAIKLSEEERLGIQRMKHYIETDPTIDCVICWEPSRLARRLDVLYSIREYLFRHKIQLYILKPHVTLLTDDRNAYDDNANTVFSLFATLAENEMMIKKERFLRAKNEMRERGQKFGGAIIFGYTKNEEKKCIPHPLHSRIIAELFNHYITTDSSLYDTYIYATSKWPDIFPIGEYKKSQRKIKHFFDTEVYVTGNWCYPPLITKEVWDKTHDKMSKAKCNARYNCKRDLLCRGKISCGYCGRMMTGCGGNVKAYVCSTNKLHSMQINSEIADWIMWEETRTIINLNSSFEITKKINEIQFELDSKNTLKIQYEERIRSLKEQSGKLLDVYMNNRVSEDIFNKKMDDINENIKIYSEKINKLNVEISTFQTMIEDTQRYFSIKPINVDKIDDFSTKMDFVRKYISKMIIKRDERQHTTHITFEYAMPVISPRSEYIYVYKNQANTHVYRINEDGTEDLIYITDGRAKRNKQTGRFEKKD